MSEKHAKQTINKNHLWLYNNLSKRNLNSFNPHFVIVTRIHGFQKLKINPHIRDKADREISKSYHNANCHNDFESNIILFLLYNDWISRKPGTLTRTNTNCGKILYIGNTTIWKLSARKIFKKSLSNTLNLKSSITFLWLYIYFFLKK